MAYDTAGRRDGIACGRLSMVEAMAAISAYVIPSLDTTINAKGHLLHDLATHPEQWAKLKLCVDVAKDVWGGA